MTITMRRSPIFFIAGTLGVLLLVGSFVWDVLHLPGDAALGLDFGAFYAAALALRQGHDPYSWAQLRAMEAHIPSIGAAHQFMAFNSYANPPLFAWVMELFTLVSSRVAYALWLVIMVIALLAGMAMLARSFHLRESGWAMLLFVATPIPVIAFFLGQQTPLLLLGVAAALAALRRGRPDLAGIALSVGWIKPHLIFPFTIVLIASLCWRDGRKVLTYWLGVSVLLGLVSWMVTGGALFISWEQDLLHYGRTMDALQPDLSSLAGLYLSVVGRPWSGYLAILLIGAWSLMAAFIIWRLRQARLASTDDAWYRLVVALLAAWLLATPYAHPADLVLLAVALPVLLGTHLEGLADAPVRLAVGVLLFAPEADLLGFRPNFVLSYSVFVPLVLLLALRPWRMPCAPRDVVVGSVAA